MAIPLLLCVVICTSQVTRAQESFTRHLRMEKMTIAYALKMASSTKGRSYQIRLIQMDVSLGKHQVLLPGYISRMLTKILFNF